MTGNKFGVNLDNLEAHEKPKDFVIRPTVPGRVLQIDADFLAYQVSYDDEKALSEMKSNCDVAIEKMRLMAGAETVVLHLTPKGSDKGDRYNAAIQREYQANRQGKAKPKFLHVIREWMHKERGAELYMHAEADDGMSMAQYKAIANGTPELSIIASKDKDLWMVPGLNLDWDTGEITDTGDDPFGWVELQVKDNKAKTKKIIGRGWKYFWAQMLTGDTADNIQGIPKICDLNFLPNGKPKACGPVLAFEILSKMKDNKHAFQIVKRMYKLYGEQIGFRDYRDNSKVPYGRVFLSEAQLLWMRRVEDSEDVLEWIGEYCL